MAASLELQTVGQLVARLAPLMVAHLVKRRGDMRAEYWELQTVALKAEMKVVQWVDTRVSWMVERSVVSKVSSLEFWTVVLLVDLWVA